MADYEHLLGRELIQLRVELLDLERRRGASVSAAYERIARAVRDGALLPVGHRVLVDADRFRSLPAVERWPVVAAVSTLATTGGVLAGSWGAAAQRDMTSTSATRMPGGPVLIVRPRARATPFGTQRRGTIMDHGVCVVTHTGFAARATSVMLAGRRVPVLEPVDCALSTMSHLRAMGSWTVAAREVAPSRFELDPEQVAIVARELGIDVSAKRVFRAWADAGYRSIGPGGFHDTLHARQVLTTSASPLVPWNPRKGYVDSYDLMHNG